jgi:hypothetical protein
MTPTNLQPKFGNVQMKPLSPKQILRNLENGFFMTHQEQTEAAEYIRQLQASNQALSEGMINYANEIVKLRRDLHNAIEFNVNVSELAEQIKHKERKACIDIVMQNVSPAMARECEDAINARNL